jgi:hypothetical protein
VAPVRCLASLQLDPRRRDGCLGLPLAGLLHDGTGRGAPCAAAGPSPLPETWNHSRAQALVVRRLSGWKLWRRAQAAGGDGSEEEKLRIGC